MENVAVARLDFRLEEPAGRVVARFAPDDTRAPPSAESICAALAEQGFGQYFIDQQALAALERNARSAVQPLEMPIGERRDGSFELQVSEDLMSVWLSMAPPHGGQPATQGVLDALREQNIVYGLLRSSLNAALSSGTCQRLLIAQGSRPVEGWPARFERLLPQAAEKRPQVNQYGIADYRNLGQLLVVHPGEPLMRRVPAQPGSNGMNVKGQAVPARPVADPAFAENLTGVSLSPDDADLLLADIVGQPIEVEHGIRVDPVIEVDDVDLKSGNIEFKGTVRVRGDIKAGMRVTASGDILVGGVIEAAEVSAGGDVVVTGGIVGHSKKNDNENEAAGFVRAAGSVTARFAENAVIEAEHTIQIEDIALESELAARETIQIGKSGSKYGHLIGGHATAARMIRATVLGAPRGTATRLQVGVDPKLYEQHLKPNERASAKLQEELDKLLQLLVHFDAHPEKGSNGVRERVERTRGLLVEQLRQLAEEHAALLAQGRQLEGAYVEVGQTIYVGVEVKIGARSWRAFDDWSGQHRLALHDGHVGFGEKS